ncbi:hypothetical protein EMCRGX_G019382 [Ephydatia muelleri]
MSALLQVLLGDQTCTRFGNDLLQAAPAQRSTTGTFVNISSSVSCPGNATRWNICYYNSTTDPSSTTYFGVYRLTSGTVYNLVNGSSIKFTIPQNNSAYACSRFPIPQSQQYTVLPGDILVVCVQTRVSFGRPTRLGIVASVTGASVLRDSTPCTSLPSSPINIGGAVYSSSSGTTLHVSLDVNECADSNGGCAQICSDLPVGKSCSCSSGYTFDGSVTNGSCHVEAITAGAIAGIVIVVILVFVVITAIVGLVILYFKKHSKRWKPSSRTAAIDNVLYEVPNDDRPTVGNIKPQVQGSDMAANMYEAPVSSMNQLVKETQFCDPTYETTFQEEEQVLDDLGDPSPYCVPATQEKDLYEQIRAQKMRKISAKEIEQGKELGHGQFGSVFKGHWNGALGHREVAIKMLNRNQAQSDTKVKLLQEAAIMAQFRHPNVIRLYGIISEGSELMLIIELAEKGDLRNHLTSLTPDPGELLKAQNIYAKQIADFGLSRDLANENYYVSTGGMVPLKWTAPEAIHYKKYSTASDVWSYGCLLYEIWSVGHKPFETMGNSDVVEKVDTGYRLPPPPGCPLLIYQTMIQCWNPDASSRIQFKAIHLSLSQGEEHVLNIPNEALQTHPKAGVLGALLEAGQKMYTDLQKTYVAPDH